jgi:hypothetical protein
MLGDVLARPEARRREPDRCHATSHWLMCREQLLPEPTNAVVCRLVNEHMSLLIKAE